MAFRPSRSRALSGATASLTPRLEAAQRERGVVGDLAGEVEHGLGEVLVVDHLVDQADARGLVGVDAAAGVEQHAGVGGPTRETSLVTMSKP